MSRAAEQKRAQAIQAWRTRKAIEQEKHATEWRRIQAAAHTVWVNEQAAKKQREAWKEANKERVSQRGETARIRGTKLRKAAQTQAENAAARDAKARAARAMKRTRREAARATAITTYVRPEPTANNAGVAGGIAHGPKTA